MLRNSEDGSERGSLLWLLDHTRTPGGGRLLRKWVAHPLRDIGLISERSEAVEELLAASAGGQGGVVAAVADALTGLPDLERGITRILHCTASTNQ